MQLSGKYLKDAGELFSTIESHIPEALWFELSEG